MDQLELDFNVLISAVKKRHWKQRCRESGKQWKRGEERISNRFNLLVKLI